MFLVFCFVLKGGRDADMLIKGRKETSREGNLDILKRERNWLGEESVESNYRWVVEPEAGEGDLIL